MKTPRVSPLQLINALHAKSHKRRVGLLYEALTVNGKDARAMIDSRTTHSFMVERELDTYGLKVSKTPSKVKEINPWLVLLEEWQQK